MPQDDQFTPLVAEAGQQHLLHLAQAAHVQQIGVFSALSIPFVLRFVPETKGKSLEQIEEEMVRR